MADDLVKRLRAQHNDTWPLKIGHGDLINEDGPEAASRIEKLEAALRKISHLDYKSAATNFAVYDAYKIARCALDAE